MYLGAIVVACGAYETWAQFNYARWKSRFDNYGWLGRLTVPSANRRLLWEYKPYGQYHGEMGDIVVNRYGFRDADPPTPQKPPGIYRVAFIGDSVTLGLLNRPEETFERHFERHGSQEAQTPIQALNFGVDGYDARQILELLRARVHAFEPDCVIYVMCLNDFDFEWSSGEKYRYFVKPRWFLGQELEELSIRLRELDINDYCFRKHKVEVFEAVKAMNELSETRQQAFLVALLPSFDAESFADYPYTELHHMIDAFLTAEGIAHVDVLEEFRMSGLRPHEVAFDIWHPNPAGNELIAKALVKLVVARLLSRP
jgi:lysophospholipase L1-like esterase